MKIRSLLYTIFSLLILTSTFSCRTADIRTTEVKNDFNQQLGLEVLQKMSKAHALTKWDNIETYSFHLTDEFYGLMGNFGNPFPNNKADFEFQAIAKTFTSKAIFKDEKWKDKIWGIQSWRTYSSEENGSIELHSKNDKTIEFWLPTYQYFIETPSRIFEAEFISYAGERKLNGKTYDLVYATWISDKPHKDVDQYILWIDKENHMLAQMQYTVRDQYKWIYATLRYSIYEQIDGVPFPKEMNISLLGPDKKKILHTVSIDNINLNMIPKDSLLVFPNLGSTGKQ